jgi:hypothetical protein
MENKIVAQLVKVDHAFLETNNIADGRWTSPFHCLLNVPHLLYLKY